MHDKVTRAGWFTALAVACLFHTSPLHAADKLPQPAWGTIKWQEDPAKGVLQLLIKKWPADGILPLPIPAPHLVNPSGHDFQFNADASKASIFIGKQPQSSAPHSILATVAHKTQQFADGRIVFSAADAKVVGKKAKLESHPGNHRIGFWSDKNDHVTWTHRHRRWGMYDILLTYSKAGPNGTEITVQTPYGSPKAKLKSTGSWYRYTTIKIARLYFPKSGKLTLSVKCLKLTGGAVMNLKAVTLKPAPEGKPIVQQKDGSITLDARDATVEGVMLRYEPNPKKLCLGFWGNPRDKASWQFTVNKPGKFKILFTQGCGKGHGGSDVKVTIAGQSKQFTVKDTGHFQNWLERDIGIIKINSIGLITLRVTPLNKKRAAVMDIRRIKLVPVND